MYDGIDPSFNHSWDTSSFEAEETNMGHGLHDHIDDIGSSQRIECLEVVFAEVYFILQKVMMNHVAPVYGMMAAKDEVLEEDSEGSFVFWSELQGWDDALFLDKVRVVIRIEILLVELFGSDATGV